MLSAAHRPTLLVADADGDLRNSVAGFMSARGYLVQHTASGIEAADVLISRSIDVLVADLAMRDKGGLELLAFAQRSAPSTRSIVIGSEPSGREREGAARLGAVRVLAKPVSLLDLADAVAVASDCGDGFHGWLHRLSLIDVLQMFHLSGQSLTLFLRGSSEGKICLRAGQIVHAECEGAVGEPALVRLLRARRGSLESAPLDHLGTTISGSFEHVLLNGIRLIDEEKRRSSRPGTHPPLRESWSSELAEPSEYQLLARWLDTHALAAHAWLVDSPSGELTQLVGAQTAPALSVDPARLASCLSLVERADPSFRRMELTIGNLSVAFLRRTDRTLIFARVGTDEEALRRFRYEVTQLARWWASEVPVAT
ncbi:MAG: response regulator [Polyangiaceae bacterium]